MQIKPKLPFQGFTREMWENLALAALLLVYLLQVVFELVWKNECANLAVDFCAFWSVGHIANTTGYAGVYDLNLLAQVQQPLFPTSLDSSLFATVPVPYLPVFIVLFQPFAFLDPIPGFALWSLFNLVGLIVYLSFFARKMTGQPLKSHFLLMFLLSLPVFLDLFWGQVNLWLMICAGEFFRAMLAGKKYRAGMWLAGLLLKPQLLFLVVPVLLLQRSWKSFISFGLASIMVLAVSLGLAGFNGIYDLIALWFGYTKGLPTNGPEIMMNWRMVAVNLNSLFPSSIGWAVVIAGSIITVGMTLFLWRSSIPVNSPNFGVALLGMFAATGAIAWHSHLSTSMILIPILIVLHKQGIFPQRIFSFWVFLPPIIKFLTFFLAALIQFSILPVGATTLLNFSFGLCGLTLNMCFLVWAYRRIHLLHPK